MTAVKPYVDLVDHPSGPLRVPWVAQWSGEVLSTPVLPPTHGRIDQPVRYSEETDTDRVLNVLWLRSGEDRSGEPDFATLNVYRQRDAIINNLCQVCGLPAGDSWLISWPETVRGGGPLHTSTPPTCAACVPIARRMCPRLNSDPPRFGPKQQRGGIWLQVKHYRPVAVWGDIVEVVGDGMTATTRHYQGELPLADPRCRTFMLGRQLVAEIYGFRRRREPPGEVTRS